MIDDLKARLEKSGQALDSTKLTEFARLLRLLQEGNDLFNLSGLRDEDAVIQRHFVESFALGRFLDERGLLGDGTRILDLGSGAGFPGLPLKLAWPALQVTLLEATSKKARFISTAVKALGLSDVRVLPDRAESLAHETDLRACFELVVARAVAPLPALIELTLPFLRLGGTLAAVKGSRWMDELAAASGALARCGGELSVCAPLPECDPLVVVMIRKIAPTPDRYPRRPGQPAAHPLRNAGS